LGHAGANCHDPGKGGIDLCFRGTGAPRTYEAALRSRFTVAGDDNGQADERFGLVIQGVIVTAVGIPPLEFVEHVRVIIHALLLPGCSAWYQSAVRAG
jgi:hypothetical protein